MPSADVVAQLTVELRRLERIRDEAAAEAAKVRKAIRALTASNRRGNQEEMVTAERLRYSAGTESKDPLRVACNTHGFTVRSLAERLRSDGYRVSHALLFQARKGKPIRREVAEAIAKLTGFAATGKNWPGGWVNP